MSNDGVSPEDQAAVSDVARGVMQQLAAGRSAEDVARDLCVNNGFQKSTADALVEHVQQDWRQIEAAPQANAGIYLQMKYPEMRPAGSPPALQTVNGIGTGFYGSRDLDRPTGSYVKTQCFCILFVPILALKAYRVASRGSGWTLIGRVPLSRFAKTWNIAFLCAIVGSIGLGLMVAHFKDPTYLAGRKLAQADEAAAAGRLLEAGQLYREVARTHTQHAAAARQRCAKLLERPEIDGLPLSDVTQIFGIAKEFAGPMGEKELFETGIAWVQHHPQAADHDVFESLDQLAEVPGADQARLAAIRRPLLEKLVAANPQNVELTVQLALAIEAEGEQGGKKQGGDGPGERIAKLLSPHREKLGAGEGARLSGRSWRRRASSTSPTRCWAPTWIQRLDAFHEAEQAYEAAIKQVRGRIIEQIRNGTAPGFDFARSNGVSTSEKQAMAMEYLDAADRATTPACTPPAKG